jgi:hypothetical protein
MRSNIITQIIFAHNRIFYIQFVPVHFQPEKRLKGNQATQGAIHTAPTIILPPLLVFTRLPLMALLSTSITWLMRCGLHTTSLSLTRPSTFHSRRHLCTSGCQCHRPRKQGQNRNQQYHGRYTSHYRTNITKNLIPIATNTPPPHSPPPQTPYSPS